MDNELTNTSEPSQVSISIAFDTLSKTLTIMRPQEIGDDLLNIGFEHLLELFNRVESEHGHVKSLALVGLHLNWTFKTAFFPRVEQIQIYNSRLNEFLDEFSTLSLIHLENCELGYLLSMSLRSSGHINLRNLALFGQLHQQQVAISALIEIRNAEIGGHLNMSNIRFMPQEGRFIPDNSVRIVGSTIGGMFLTQQCKIDNHIRIEDTSVGKGFKFTETVVTGQLYMRNVSIVGDADIADSEFTSTGTAISMANVAVSGSMLIKKNRIQGQFFCHTPKVGMNYTFEETTIIANGQNTASVRILGGQIASYLIAQNSCSFQGTFDVTNTKIGADVSVRNIFARTIRKSSKLTGERHALHFRQLHIGGLLEILNCNLDGGVSTARSHIDGNLHFSRNKVSLQGGLSPTVQPWFFQLGRKIVGAVFGTKWLHKWFGNNASLGAELDFSQMRVGGNIVIHEIDLSADPGLLVCYDNTTCVRIRDENLRAFKNGRVYGTFEQFEYSALSEDATDSDYRDRIRMLRDKGRRGDMLPASAQPYFHLSQMLERAGHQELADMATIAMKRAVRSQLRQPVNRLFSFLFDLGFGYGLSKTRTAVTLAAFLALGTFGVEAALRDQMLIQETSRVVGSVAVTENGRMRPANSLVPPGQAIVSEIPCTTEIQAIFYAIELILPIMEFGQEKQCILRLAPAADGATQSQITGWWAARYLYTISGWLLISLAVITFSGVVRHQRRD